MVDDWDVWSAGGRAPSEVEHGSGCAWELVGGACVRCGALSVVEVDEDPHARRVCAVCVAYEAVQRTIIADGARAVAQAARARGSVAPWKAIGLKR